MVRKFQRQLFPVWAYALLLMGVMGAATLQAATTPAGTVIKNLATVTYQDSAGNQYSAQSNESVVTVAEVYGAMLQNDQTKEAAPGQTVYFAHQLINNGNTRDVFNLTIDPTTGSGLTGIKIYNDINGNGQPDANEPEVKESTEFVVQAGNTTNLIVAAQVPASGSVESYTVSLKATPKNRVPGSEEKLENTDTINITNGPVLVATKKVLLHEDPVGIDQLGTVEYAITVKNNGTDAKNAEIYDFLPTLLSYAAQEEADSRLQDFNGEKAITAAKLPRSVTLPDYVANNKAVFAKIPELKSGETVTLKFTATYEYKGAGSFSADDTLRNKAYVFYGKRDGDLDTSSKNKKVVVETNETVTKLPAFYGFEARGRGTDTQPDSIPTWVDETDIIDSAVPGDVVIFKTKIHNLGNGKDAFTLGIADDGFTFPKGTTFSFWDQTGAIALGNKTPEVAKGGQYILTIKAVLPPDAEAKKDKSKATLELASVGGGSGNNVALLLKSIKEATGSIDLAYANNSVGKSPDRDEYGSNQPGSNNNHEVVPGKTVAYEFTLYNESSVSRSFKLNAFGGDLMGSKGNYTNGQSLPEGWTVVFTQNDNTISGTQPVPAGKSITLIAKLTVSANASPGDGHFSVIAEGSKGGNDALKFFATVKHVGDLTLTPNGANQIEAGGSVYYNHELRNQSNGAIDGNITLTVKDTLPAGWSYLLFTVDKNGKESTGQETLTIAGAEIASKDAFQRIKVKVMAPANATPGEARVLVLQAEYSLGGSTKEVEVIDSTTVIKGQVRLYKKAFVLSGKDKDDVSILPEAKALALSDFKEVPAARPIPGTDYVVWQIIARNEGDSPAQKVIIRDAAPAFTSLTPNSAYVVNDNGAVESGVSGSEVVFNVGDGATTEKGHGGTLDPGESVEVRFIVKVN